MSTQNELIVTEALRLHAAGLCVLPAFAKTKVPAVSSWKQYQTVRPTEPELSNMMHRATALCVICGEVSGHVELLDFDVAAEQFEAWANLVRDRSPGLLERLYLERSQSGGMHAVYRCAEPVDGAMKLSGRVVACESADEVTIAGKSYKPQRNADGGFKVALSLIETKGERGLFLCAPSPGYERVQGDLASLPVLTSSEHAVLIDAAIELDQRPRVANEPSNLRTTSRSSVLANGSTSTNRAGTRPGDIYNAEGDIRPLLMNHGWTLSRTGDNEYWTRPGKSAGTSATFNGSVFFVFSSNAPPFEPDRGYSKFAVFALLEHEGDFGQAARALKREARRSGTVRQQPRLDTEVIMSANDDADVRQQSNGPAFKDPGPLPSHLLSVPGFISSVAEYTLASAHYPEPVLALSGALALQSVLAGRCVRDNSDARCSLYVVSLANSGTGKEAPRKTNQNILIEAGMGGSIGDGFASGEGIEDRMEAQPSVLFQTDEIDALIQAIAGATRQRDPRYEGIMQVLLKMFSASSSVYTMRVKASQTGPRIIDQPCLCMFGTAIPATFFQALSPKMLSNGFFARLLIFQAGPRGRGQDAEWGPVPAHLLEVAKLWAARQPGFGGGARVTPMVVPYDADASTLLRYTRERADDAYRLADQRGDQVGMALWARVVEKVRRLVLNYACSVNPESPQATKQAVQWASDIVEHQTRFMEFHASQHVSGDTFEARCKALLRLLTEWSQSNADEWMPYWRISRELCWEPREHEAVRQVLLDQRRIEYRESSSGGRPGKFYRLRISAQ